MSRYGDNIRRIAQTEDLTGRIRQAEQKLILLEKTQIPGGRAIAYPNGVTENGAPGATNPDQGGSPDNGSLFSGTDPMDSGGRDDDVANGDDIIDGDQELTPGDDIGSLELEDCASGDRIDVRFNTGSNDGEAIFKHPDGWDINGPQIDPTYQDGFVWTLSSGGTPYFSNYFNGLIDTFKTAGSWAYCYKIEGGLVASLTVSAGDALIQFTNTVRTVGQAPIGGVQYSYTSDGSVGTGEYGQVACGTVVGDTAACEADPPPQYTSWQEQEPTTPHQLAFSANDGGFVSSQYDEGLPAKFKNDVGSERGMNNLKLCTPTGNAVVVSALRDGTFAYFEDDGFGMPATNANIYHFDQNGIYTDLMREDEYSYLRITGP